MTPDPLVVPLAADCELFRKRLIEQGVPSVASLDALTARELDAAGNALIREQWQPPLSECVVTFHDAAAGPSGIRVRRYVPGAATESGIVLVWMHGGGWVLGDLDTAHGAALTAADETAWEVISVGYRCAPEHPFPAAVDDCLEVTTQVLDSGRRVVVGGDSAGGNLAAVVAQHLGGHPGLVGQVLIYPAADPSCRYPSMGEFVEPPLLTYADMAWFYNEYLIPTTDRADPRVDLFAGLAQADHTPVPAVVLTVGHDPLRDEGLAYSEALRRAGGHVDAIHAPELFHGAFTRSGVLPSCAHRVREVWAASRQLFT